MATEYVNVDDYVLDKNNAAKGIRAAIQYAREHKKQEIIFGAGTYYLTDYVTIDTVSIAHDDGCGDIREKDCHLLLEDFDGITLKGRIAEDGSPMTILAGYNSQIVQTQLPAILWVNSCVNLTLKNLAFTREPETASAGIVRAIEKDTIIVEVFEGLPCYDNMGAYCMNRFNLMDKSLLGASLTFGFGFDTRFIKIGDRQLSLTDSAIAGIVKVGDGLSWHQAGKTDFQLFLGNCTNLIFENIRVYNTNSFAVLTENCKNISADRLIIKPKGNQLFTGPRDGWKIYRCTGKILIDNCHTEGVRMDGQNIHSNFMIVQEVLSANSVLCTCKYAPIPLTDGYKMEFYDGNKIYENEIDHWEFVGGYSTQTIQSNNKTAGVAKVGTANHITLYQIQFKRPLENFIQKGCLMTPLCWEPNLYICKNSTFHNIAGAGHLLRCGEVTIEKCQYKNLMNAGILMGAEFDTHCEGGHAVNVKISECTFDNCGFKPRYGDFGCGCIAIKSQGFQEPLNQHILIEKNQFLNSKIALEIRDAQDVQIRNNYFDNITNRYIIEEISTKDIAID
ncbi:MAG: hypothetical protein K0R21_815 [Anaerocolumna sp.]|jgi:hypothetical protein|nr:hypothetical protein [Anaerocolumna sp.]